MNLETIKILNKLKNNDLIHKKRIVISKNKSSIQIIKLLYREGYILSYKNKENSTLEVNLKEYVRIPAFKNLKICSTASKTLYLSYKHIASLNTKKSLYVFSTNKGIITGNECKNYNLGGVLLFYC